MNIIIFLVCTVVFCKFYRVWRAHIGFVFFSVIAIYVISILWVPYYLICNQILGAGWEDPVEPVEFLGVGVTFCSAIYLSILAKRTVKFSPSPVSLQAVSRFSRTAKGRVFVFFGWLVGAAALLALVATKGITLSVGNYGSRFESNTGTGMFSIFSYVIVSISIISLVRRPTRFQLSLSLTISIIYGIALFLTLGGERNYLVAAVAPILLVAYMLGLIDGKRLIAYVLIGVTGVTGLALVRYGNQLSSEAWVLVAQYTRDTVFPVESLSSIFYRDNLRFVGFEYFFDQFYSVIPRFLWPEKPVYLDTIAYYFTQQIYVYNKGLIIAPTGVGSLYLMGGWLFVVLGVIGSIAFFFFLDYLVFNKGALFFISVWPTLFFSFFSFRESVELGLFKIIVHSVGIIVLYGIALCINSILPKKRSFSSHSR
jgi:hypothetical protein